jgi:exonuclease SbcD
MVRLLHTSDWHLGRILHGTSLLEDQAFALDRLIELIEQVKPHGLLIAGDIFDRPTPPEAAITLFDSFLSRVAAERNLPVFLIPGNHDSAERLGFASRLLRDRNLTIFARPEDCFCPVQLDGDNGAHILIYGIPFVEPPVIAHVLNRADIQNPDQAVTAMCREMLERVHSPANQTKLSPPAVLLCHAFVTGGESSESEKEIFIGGSSNVDARAFEGFAYTALGHLHKPQRAGHPTVRYSGSLLAYSKSEISHTKSITEVRIAQDGQLEIETHELPKLRQLKYIEGELDELLNRVEQNRCDDYVLVGLLNATPAIDTFSRLRKVYPNLLNVTRLSTFTPEALPTLRREQEQLSDLDLFAEFFRDSTGEDLSAPHREALIETLRSLERSEEGLS